MTQREDTNRVGLAEDESIVGPTIIISVVLVAFAFLTAVTVANFFFPGTGFAQWTRHIWEMRQSSGPLPPPLH